MYPHTHLPRDRQVQICAPWRGSGCPGATWRQSRSPGPSAGASLDAGCGCPAYAATRPQPLDERNSVWHSVVGCSKLNDTCFQEKKWPNYSLLMWSSYGCLSAAILRCCSPMLLMSRWISLMRVLISAIFGCKESGFSSFSSSLRNPCSEDQELFSHSRCISTGGRRKGRTGEGGGRRWREMTGHSSLVSPSWSLQSSSSAGLLPSFCPPSPAEEPQGHPQESVAAPVMCSHAAGHDGRIGPYPAIRWGEKWEERKEGGRGEREHLEWYVKRSSEMLMMVVRKEKAESTEGREMGQVKKGGVITWQRSVVLVHVARASRDIPWETFHHHNFLTCSAALNFLTASSCSFCLFLIGWYFCRIALTLRSASFRESFACLNSLRALSYSWGKKYIALTHTNSLLDWNP